MVPELAGNPFLPQLFALWDRDKDDKLTQEEFNAAIDTFLRAQTPEEKMQCAHFLATLHTLLQDLFQEYRT